MGAGDWYQPLRHVLPLPVGRAGHAETGLRQNHQYCVHEFLSGRAYCSCLRRQQRRRSAADPRTLQRVDAPWHSGERHRTRMQTELSHDMMVSETGAAITKRIPAGHWGRPEDLAGVTVFLASAASDYISGNVIQVDGGYLCN